MHGETRRRFRRSSTNGWASPLAIAPPFSAQPGLTRRLSTSQRLQISVGNGNGGGDGGGGGGSGGVGGVDQPLVARESIVRVHGRPISTPVSSALPLAFGSANDIPHTHMDEKSPADFRRKRGEHERRMKRGTRRTIGEIDERTTVRTVRGYVEPIDQAARTVEAQRELLVSLGQTGDHRSPRFDSRGRFDSR